MLQSIRNRLILLGVLVAASAWGLWPRDVIHNERQLDGSVQQVVHKEWNIRKGLDLQGGMHLALEIDKTAGPVVDEEDALNRAETVIRSRIDEFGVAEPVIQRVGAERIIVELPGIDDPARAKEIVERSAFLEFRITDMENRFYDALPRIDAALAQAGIKPRGSGGGGASLTQLLGTSDSTADTTGTADSTQAEDEAAADEPVFTSLLQQQGQINGEYLVLNEDFAYADSLINLPAFQQAIPRGIVLRWGADTLVAGGRPYRALYALQNQAIITGADLSDAQATIDQTTFNQAVVNFQLNRAGGRKFARETARNINNYMAIVLDGRVRGQPPVIRSQIRQRGQIELNSTLQEAQDLALVLRAGALPAPLQIVEERTVGPSLGEDSVSRGQTAGMVAIALVVLIIALYYRTAGLFAIIALGFYVLFALGGLGMLEATLTLPGLAGFVLSVGLAVDANVLIFERIREELALNKSPRTAVDAGFDNAMPAIIDANVTTVILTMFLFQFGTGPIKGFAVTLIIGIIASLITAIFVTRTFLLIWLQRRAPTAELSI